MRILLPFVLGLPLFSMACLVAPAEPGPQERGDGVERTDEPPSAGEGRGDTGGGEPVTGGGPVNEPSRPGFYAKAMLASEIPGFDEGGGAGGSGGGDGPVSPDDPFSDPNRLLVFLSSEPFACAEPFGASVCTTDRTSWSVQFTLWPRQQEPGRYDLLEQVNGGYSELRPDPDLICPGAGGSAAGVVVVDAIDERSVRFHFERAQLFSPEIERALLSGGPFVAERCR